MASKRWEVYKIGDACELITGFPFKSKEYLDDGKYRVVRGDNVKSGYLYWKDKTRCWDELNDRLEKYLLRENDIVIGMDGSRVGKNRAIVNQIDLPAILAQRVACLRSNSRFSQDYIRYVIMSSEFENYVKSIKTGTSIPHISLKQISEFTFLAPSLEEQNVIAHILSTLDEKIETNNQINRNLEEMAQALFKHWFVDFEFPNEDGEPYKSSGGEMVESELGMIPKGWRVHRNSEIFELLYGKALKAEDRCKGLYPVYGSNGIVGYHNEALVKGPGIVVGRKGNPGTVNFVWDDFYPIDTTFYVDSKVSIIYLYFALEAQNLDKLGTDSAVPGLNRNIAYMNLILIPNENNLKCFDETIIPTFNYIKCKERENNQLLALRDTLLPKLMSGEIRVPLDQEGEA